MKKDKPKTVEDYIRSLPSQAKSKLEELRSILKKVAPNATEAIKWGYPVMEEKRILFSFSAFKTHINFMPTRSTLIHFQKYLKNYKTGKDTIQFPLDKPLPKTLIKKIALYRAKDVQENNALWAGQK